VIERNGRAGAQRIVAGCRPASPLPFLRIGISVDHGAAFDIAGTGRADPHSMVAAPELAARFARRS